MKFTISGKKTLRELIVEKDPTLLDKLNPRRITGSDAVSYGIFIKWNSGTVFVETLVGDTINIVNEGLPLAELKVMTMDISKLQWVWFDGNGEILVSFL